MNLEATVFVYERRQPPHDSVVVYLDDANRYDKDPEWFHASTLNPAAWIRHLLNNPKQQADIIRQLTRK